MCIVFRGIHALLLSIIESPLKVSSTSLNKDINTSTTTNASSSFKKKQFNNFIQKSESILVKEAALVIKIGFVLFYPTSKDSSLLLEHAMKGKTNVVLLHAVMDRLSEETSVASMLDPLLHSMLTSTLEIETSPEFHLNTSNKTIDLSDSPSKNSTSTTAGNGAMNSVKEEQDVDVLMSDLLSHTVKHLHVAAHPSATNSKVNPSPYLKLLLALQTHLSRQYMKIKNEQMNERKKGEEGSGSNGSGDSGNGSSGSVDYPSSSEKCLLTHGACLIRKTSESVSWVQQQKRRRRKKKKKKKIFSSNTNTNIFISFSFFLAFFFFFSKTFYIPFLAVKNIACNAIFHQSSQQQIH